MPCRGKVRAVLELFARTTALCSATQVQRCHTYSSPRMIADPFGQILVGAFKDTGCEALETGPCGSRSWSLRASKGQFRQWMLMVLRVNEHGPSRPSGTVFILIRMYRVHPGAVRPILGSGTAGTDRDQSCTQRTEAPIVLAIRIRYMDVFT